MTYEEANEIMLKNIPLFDTFNAPLCEALKLAKEALEKADKYRWHDASKEFPKDTDHVLVKYEWEDGSFVYQTDYCVRGKWKNDHHYVNGKVTKWKEIEED